MIINPTSDRICECGRRGCVENELTTSAIKRRIIRYFSKEQTPFLYQAAKGSADNITMELVLAAYAKRDPAVLKVIDSLLLMMAVLINNLYFSTNPQKIVLHKFPFSNELSYEKLKDTVTRIGGERVANAVSLSFVEDKHHFLSGCALAIRELFYNCGGYSSDASENLHHDITK